MIWPFAAKSKWTAARGFSIRYTRGAWFWFFSTWAPSIGMLEDATVGVISIRLSPKFQLGLSNR
jgi:hypothetical protein